MKKKNFFPPLGIIKSKIQIGKSEKNLIEYCSPQKNKRVIPWFFVFLCLHICVKITGNKDDIEHPRFEYNTSLERTCVSEMKSFVKKIKFIKNLNTILKT